MRSSSARLIPPFTALASIVGDFAAGLLLEGVHIRHFVERGEAPLEQPIKFSAVVILTTLITPVGLKVSLGRRMPAS